MSSRTTLIAMKDSKIARLHKCHINERLWSQKLIEIRVIISRHNPTSDLQKAYDKMNMYIYQIVDDKWCFRAAIHKWNYMILEIIWSINQLKLTWINIYEFPHFRFGIYGIHMLKVWMSKSFSTKKMSKTNRSINHLKLKNSWSEINGYTWS